MVHEFTGRRLLDSEARARLQPISGNSRVVLLLLPHSPDLFLLQIGLILCGKVPAVLPWPTTRVDGVKYQRNLMHQLNHLPADHLITLPRLAQNLQTGVDFPVSGCELANGNQFETMFLERFIPEARQPTLAIGMPHPPRRCAISPILGGYDGNTKVRRGDGRDARRAGFIVFRRRWHCRNPTGSSPGFRFIMTWASSRVFIFLCGQAFRRCISLLATGCYGLSCCSVIFRNIALPCAGFQTSPSHIWHRAKS